jgi:cysteine-rich repeat protein
MHDRTSGRFVLVTLLLALGTTAPAAAIDLSGDYVGFALVPFTVTDVQTGTALQMIGHVVFNSTTYPLSTTGTVDPATGAFSVAGEITGLCPEFVYSGTGDGEELTGTFTSPTCPSGPVFLTKCGNGVIDPLENCEDGNYLDGDCCSARCRLDPAGTACMSDGNDCTADVCNPTGTCTHVPITGRCEDGNACTIGDVCAAGACVPSSPAPAGQACTHDLDSCTADVCDAGGACTHVPVPPAECGRAVACHSTCTQQLKACRRTCPDRGQARRKCRADCAERSTCTAPGAAIRTLAYVVTECRTDPQGFASLGQKLLVRRGNCDPVTVMELGPFPPVRDPLFASLGGICRAWGEGRFGPGSSAGGYVQRMAVLPDASGVVFEVTNDHSAFPETAPEPPAEGIFFARSDGSGLRWLAPASRVALFIVPVDARGRPLRDRIGFTERFFGTSPSGRMVAYTDLGRGPDGRDAREIYVLHLDTGQRTQLTNLGPDAVGCCPAFTDDRTIVFRGGGDVVFRVKTDGNPPDPVTSFTPLPGSRVVPEFQVAGGATQVVVVGLDEPAINSHPGLHAVEVFLLDGERWLQLTNFHRNDTLYPVLLGRRVLFRASAPTEDNPGENCQLFSVSTFGGRVRQLTHFSDLGRPSDGCWFGPGRGLACAISGIAPEPATGAVVFGSSCDPPAHTNPYGFQLFSMRADGSGLRQLTATSGMVIEPDGSVRVEMPGPFAYPAVGGGLGATRSRLRPARR